MSRRIKFERKSAGLIAAAALLWCVVTHTPGFGQTPQPLTFNNVLVYQAGSGTNALNSTTGNDVLLQEFTPSGTLVQTIALPASGAGTKLITAGAATSEGALSISPDGRWIGFSGYNAAIGQATSTLTSSVSGSIPRVAGILNATTGTYALTVMGTWFSANSPRGVASNDGNNVWAVGGGNGLVYGTLDGVTPFNRISGTAIATNMRGLSVFGEGASAQLYASSGANNVPTVGVYGPTPLPTGTATTLVAEANVPSMPTSPVSSRYGFVYLDVNPLVSGVDTLYVADDSATSGGIWKYSLDTSGTWNARGTIQGLNLGLRGMAGLVSGSNVRLFATSSGTMFTYWDSDAIGSTLSGTSTLLSAIATAAPNTAFRGVLVVPEPGTVTMCLAGAVGLLVVAAVRRVRRPDQSRARRSPSGGSGHDTRV